MTRVAFVVASAMSLLVGACASDPRQAGGGAQASTYSQGSRLQGTKLQGTKLQGTKLQGTKLQGSRLQGVELEGLRVDAGRLVGRFHGRVIHDRALVGLSLSGVADDGSEIAFRIDSADPDPGDPSGETWLYGVSYQDPDTLAWSPACEEDAAGEAKAIPLAATWNDSGDRVESSSLFTFACTSGVLAKCVRWGYRPWDDVGWTSLAPYHQACTRMARADYCGNGTPHTHDGTLIDVYDPLGIQTRTPNSGMLFEAAWTPSGAYCIGKQRWNVVSQVILLECPQKVALPGLFDLLGGCETMLAPSGTTVRVRNDSLLTNLDLFDLL